MIDEDMVKKITKNLITSLKSNALTLKMAKEIIEKVEEIKSCCCYCNC